MTPAAGPRLQALRQAGDTFALAPQVLAEFVRVITDAKRFSQPLAMNEALDCAEIWWNAPEIEQITPDAEAMRLFLDWMRAHQLGRKRVLDTMLATTFRSAGISSVLTTNARDFATFGGFTLVAP